MNFLPISNIITLVILLANLVIGVFILIKGRRKKLNISFSVFLFITAFWLLTNFLFVIDPSLTLIKAQYAFGTLVLLSSLVWIYLITDKRLEKKVFYSIVSFSVIVFILPFLDGLVVKDIIINEFDHSHDLIIGPLFDFYSIILILIYVFLIYKLIKSLIRSKGLQKSQIKYILTGTFMFGSASIFFNFILPFFNIVPVASYDAQSSIFFVAFTTIAIIKYRLMDIRVIMSKLYTYIVLAAFSYFYFHLVYLIDIRFFGNVYYPSALILGAVFAILFAAVFLPLLNYIQKSSDVLFFKGHNPRSIIKDLTIELRGAIKLEEIFVNLQKNFKKVLEVEDLRILIFEDAKKGAKNCISEKYSFNPINLAKKDKLCANIYRSKNLIIQDEVKEKFIAREMEGVGARIIAPLISQDRVFGAVILGDKIDQSAYTQEDIEFLEIISTQAAVAIQNALLYQEVYELNKNLEKKVEEQTAEIKQKADHLQKLLAMRSEFLDIASHQLRTPVTVIKGALSMILDGSITDEAKKKEFLEASFKKSMKLTDIINDILRASEMDTDKFELDLKPVDIHTLIEEVVEGKQMEADDKKLELKLSLPKKRLPEVMSDKRYIEQVVVNLINNSLQYTKKGYIKVEAKKQKDHVVVKVSDTGIGIPKKDQKKLFTKFGRAQNAVETFTDGSGLGLFIIKQVMDAHKGGEVYIENTEVGKGTTFVLKLPIAK